jgi:antitoxin PrlF
MKDFVSSISPKGQVTIPMELRKFLGVKPKDKVTFTVEGQAVKITPARSRLAASFQAVPALKRPRTLEEMAEIAADEHAQHVACEGL